MKNFRDAYIFIERIEQPPVINTLLEEIACFYHNITNDDIYEEDVQLVVDKPNLDFSEFTRFQSHEIDLDVLKNQHDKNKNTPSSDPFPNGIDEFPESQDAVKFWKLINILQSMIQSSRLTLNQEGQIYVDCAYMISGMGKNNRAVILLQDAHAKYAYFQHHNAIAASWMRGYLLWRIPAQKHEAIVEWDKSMAALKNIYLLRNGGIRFDKTKLEQYAEALKKMNESLLEHLENFY